MAENLHMSPSSLRRHTRSASRASSPSGFPITRRAYAACRASAMRTTTIDDTTAPAAVIPTTTPVPALLMRRFDRVDVNPG